MSQFHVNQIEAYVREKYWDEHVRANLDDVNNLSRLLGLHAIDTVLPDGPERAHRMVEITDGSADRGIDAIAVDPTNKVLVLVQSKWRQNGTGGLTVAEVTRFTDGARSLIGMGNADEPVHGSEELRQAVRELLVTPSATIHLVTVTTASDDVSAEAAAVLNDLLRSLNDLEGVDDVASHTHLDQAALFTSISGRQGPAVDLDVTLLDWGATADPIRIYYGRVSGADIAQWHQEHGPDLFGENIRVVIPRSDINAGILQTVEAEPDRFGYYNNGITVLASEIETAPGGHLNRDVGHLRLKGASVVNGAQTVSTLGGVLDSDDAAKLGQVFVLVRCIQVDADDDQLARDITRYANTQNEVTSQDFAFLDDEQHRLAEEIAAVGFEYLIRQAEIPKSEDPTRVITVLQAAVGLACADPDLGLAVIAKREVSRLVRQEGGEYQRLFNGGTDPLLLIRSVQITREVERVLDLLGANETGNRLGIAVHGKRAIAHLYMQEVGRAALQDPDTDGEQLVADVADRVTEMVDAAEASFPANSYAGNLFKNRRRVEVLFTAAGILT